MEVIQNNPYLYSIEHKLIKTIQPYSNTVKLLSMENHIMYDAEGKEYAPAPKYDDIDIDFYNIGKDDVEDIDEDAIADKEESSRYLRIKIKKILKFIKRNNIPEEYTRSLKKYVNELALQITNKYKGVLKYKDLEGKYAKYVDNSHQYNNIVLMKIDDMDYERNEIHFDILVETNFYHLQPNENEIHIHTHTCRLLGLYDIDNFTIITPEEFEQEYNNIVKMKNISKQA